MAFLNMHTRSAYDAGVGPTAADVAVHEVDDLALRGMMISNEQRNRRHDHSRCTVPTLQRAFFEKCLLIERILGVSAQRIDGIDVMTIQTVVAEVGTDLRAWETEAHWTSWLNLAPKRDIIPENTTPTAWGMPFASPPSPWYSVSYLGARYRYLRAKLGGLKAVKAMARVLACLFYRLVTKGQLWIDQGAEEFERRRQQRDLASLQRRARNLGMQLVPAA